MSDQNSGLTPLPSTFGHGSLDRARYLTNGEILLDLAPAAYMNEWGREPARSPARIRLRGLLNPGASRTFVEGLLCPLEIARFGYTRDGKSRPGRLCLELIAERSDEHHVFICRSIHVYPPPETRHP